MNIELSYHSNGSIAAEVCLINGRPHGVTRHWHTNGVLAAEISIDHGVLHGTTSRWNEKGILLGRCEFVQGTGLQRMWHPNGQLSSEAQMIGGKLTGPFSVYFPDGQRASVEYYLEGKKVSKKRYLEASASGKSPSEPIAADEKPDDFVVPPRPEGNVGPVAEGHFAALIAGPGACEAWGWLTEDRPLTRTLGEAMSDHDARDLVKRFYTLGAVAVHVVEVHGSDDEHQNTGRLVVELLKDRKERHRLFRYCDVLCRRIGYVMEADVDQTHVILMLD